MEEKKEDAAGEGKSCCKTSSGCCGCKALKALVLLLVGGVIGFMIANCRGHRMCPMPTTSTQYGSDPIPAAPPAAAKAK